MTTSWRPPAWPDLAWSWADADKAKAGAFTPSRAAERRYERALRSLAAKIGDVLTTHPLRAAEEILRDYAEAIDPWARQIAANMVRDVERDNAAKFARLASRMGYDMRSLIRDDAVGRAVAARIEENARLIKSLVIDSAQKAGELAHESLITGMRAEDMAEEIYGLNGVTKARAKVIAVTETSKASTALTQARAEEFGGEGYIWRSVRDGATRPSHRAMEGKFVKWSEPPTLDGMTGHAGEFPNCRCYPEPVIPRSDGKGAYRQPLPTYEEERESGKKRLLTQWEKAVGSEVIPQVPDEPLFNVDKAKFSPGKLVDYSLDPGHSRGKDKAKVWKASIGATQKDAPKIRKQVLTWLEHLEAVPKGKPDDRGVKFNVKVPVTGPNGQTVDVTTAWIYDRSEDGKTIATFPRLTTIYVPEESHAF